MPNIPPQIKNIIFDLGEVFTDIHFNETVEAFNALAPNGEISLYSYKSQTSLFNDLETGVIQKDKLVSELQKVLKAGTVEAQIFNAWNAMIGETHIELLQLANSLRPNYRTFILSNTNQIHIDEVCRTLKNKGEMNCLNPYFDKVYFSHDIGCRKPNADAFEFVLADQKLIAAETLFIDDKEENVEAARNLNLIAWQLNDKNELYNWLK